MLMKLVADDQAVAQVRTDGKITQETISGKPEPFTDLLGSDAFTRRVIVDLSGSDYVDSSGVGLLLNFHKKFRQGGGRLVYHSIPVLVQNVLKMLRMELVLTLARDADAAKQMALGDGK